MKSNSCMESFLEVESMKDRLTDHCARTHDQMNQ